LTASICNWLGQYADKWSPLTVMWQLLANLSHTCPVLSHYNFALVNGIGKQHYVLGR